MTIYNDGQYAALNENWHIEDSEWKARQALKMLRRNNISARTYCEVGCGAGEILVQLAAALPAEAQFSGYDIAPLEYFWDQRSRENIKFVRSDFTKVDAFFDVLMVLDVVEHLENYFEFLRSIRSRAKYKLFNIPLEIFALKALFGHKFLDSRKQYGHIHYFNKDIAISLLQELGYDILDYFYAPRAVVNRHSSHISAESRYLKPFRRLGSKISVDLTAKLLGGYSLYLLAK